MPSNITMPAFPVTRGYPSTEVDRALRKELQSAATDTQLLKGGWEPELDSLQCVGTLLTLEKIVGFKLPPEKLVRRGGYRSVEDGLADMSGRLRAFWNELQGQKGVLQ